MLLRAYRQGWVLAVLASLLAVPAVRGQGEKQPAQPGMLPTGEALMDEYIKKTGGKAAYEKVKTTLMKGTMTMGGLGLNGDIVLQLKAPNLKHFTLDLKGLGKVEGGSDGKVSWENSVLQGPKIHDPTKDDDSMLGLDLGSDANWRKEYKSAKTEGEEKYKGKDVYRVKLETKKGEPEFRYFDKATGFVLRMKKPIKSALGTLMTDVDVGDYKKVGDLQVPHTATIEMAGQKVELRFTTVEMNVDIPDSAFVLPEAVKELLKKKEQPKDSDK